MSARSVPVMITDEEAEAFLGQNLYDLDFTAFRPLRWGGRDDRAGGRPGEAREAATSRRHLRA